VIASEQLPARTTLAEQDGAVVGWAAIDPPGSLSAEADAVAARPLVEWLLATAQARVLTINVLGGDTELHDVLTGFGFRPSVDHVRLGLHRAVAAHPPVLASGYRIRSVEPGEEAARVAVHRAAWHPADLPWHPEHRPASDPEATSSFYYSNYELVRRTWLYDSSFDLVAVAPDGSFAACCLGWFDPATGWAEIEPLGVVPDHRNRGLAGALCLEIAARVGARGGREIFINTGPRADYRAPAGAYQKAGFTTFTRGLAYELRR
jgi:GNAT superfamily N-acetyltransferase